MNNSIGKRIREARGELTQKEVAAKTGVAPTSIVAYERGDRNPRPPVLRSLSEALCVREKWLQYGTGEMKPEVVEEKPRIEALNGKGTIPMLKEGETAILEMVGVPLMAGEAALGDPTEVLDTSCEKVELPRRMLPHPTLSYALRVKGESMEPMIKDGMVIIVDAARRDPYMLRGRIVVVRMDDTVTVKRLIEQDGHFHIIADNPGSRFRSLELDLRGGNTILGEVVCIVR